MEAGHTKSIISTTERDCRASANTVLTWQTAVVNTCRDRPIKVLGLRPSAGVEILADVGILRGVEGRTMQRVYWSNQDTTLVSDLPSEARLRPGEWGLWKFSD